MSRKGVYRLILGSILLFAGVAAQGESDTSLRSNHRRCLSHSR